MELHLLLLPSQTHHREISLLAHKWANQQLARILSLDPVLIQWDTTHHGKPFLASHPSLHFNLSHRRNLVVLLIDSDEVGIDIEAHQYRDFNKLVRRYFHPQEQAWFQSQPNQTEAFYTLWTAKEALLKGEGIGIRQKLSLFSVIDDKGTLASPLPCWKLFSFVLFETAPFTITLCWKTSPPPSTITIWREEYPRILPIQKVDKNTPLSVLYSQGEKL